MISRFPDIFNVEFTSGMRSVGLDKVKNGAVGWQKVLDEFLTPFFQGPGRHRHRRDDP